MSVPRFSFLPPSTGDKLLASATTCELKIHRLPPGWSDELPAGDESIIDEPAADRTAGVEVSYELRGELPASGREAAHLVAALLREFRAPRSPRQAGGDV